MQATTGEMDISEKNMEIIPASLFQQTRIYVLWAHSNYFRFIPPEISCLSKLTIINLNKNLLECVCPELFTLTDLVSLNLANNRISTLPPEISQLTNLSRLDIGGNMIEELPIEITSLINLEALYIQDENSIASVKRAPVGLSNIPCWKSESASVSGPLERIDYYIHPEVECLNEVLKANKSMTAPRRSLSLARKKLTNIHLIAELLDNFHFIDLSYNELSRFPSAILSVSSITSLHISNNKIKALPSGITRLHSLKEFSSCNNEIDELPYMRNLSSLKRLNLRGNKFNPEAQHFLDHVDLHSEGCVFPEKNLTCIPVELLKLPWEPRIVDFSKNKISCIPDFLSQLTFIEDLRLSENQIVQIPPVFEKFERLNLLDVSKNQIEVLPVHVVKSSNLRSILYDGNPLLNIPPHIISDGREAVFDFVYASIGGMVKCQEGRLLLIGESGTGKTSIKNSLEKNKQVEVNDRTDGIEQNEIDICDVQFGHSKDKIKVKVWDFGGQDEFQATHPFFLSSGALVIVVYRLDQDKAANNLNRWIKMLDDFAPGSKIIIVGTHLDKKERTLMQEMQKEIETFDDGRHTFLKTDLRLSNLNGKGISELTQVIYQGMLQLDNINMSIPRSYFLLKEYLESKNASIKYESVESVQEFGEKTLNMNRHQCESALKFLHNLGCVIWLSNYEEMKGIVFLDPTFLISIFRCVFSFKGLGKGTQGIIPTKRLKDKIKEEVQFGLNEIAFDIILSAFDRFGLGVQYNQECIAFPSLLENIDDLDDVWNVNPETHCISELSMVMTCENGIQPSDKSNIIAEALRLVKGFREGCTYGDIFYANAAVIHLSTEESESDEIKLVSGDAYAVLIHIQRSKIIVTTRKYDLCDTELHNFNITAHFYQKIASIRPNFITRCQIGCYECQRRGFECFVEFSKELGKNVSIRCPRGNELQLERLKKGRLFIEPGSVKKSPPKLVRQRTKRKLDYDSDIGAIDQKLAIIWAKEPAEPIQYIGSGAYGRVYNSIFENSRVVVKIQTIKETRSQTICEVIESLIYESEFMYECRECHNIPKLLGVYVRDTDFFMVMENAGVSLKTAFEKQKIRPGIEEISSYTKQICQGLQFMHSKDLYHEDLTADNVMILNKQIRIIDFGIVSRRSLEKVGSHLPTRFGEWKQGGTEKWQAPEIHEVVARLYHTDISMYGKDETNIGHRGEPSCVYSLGMLVWYMFSCVEPFKSRGGKPSMKGLRPLINGDTPVEFRHLIAACWRQNYKLRPSISAILNFLEDLEQHRWNIPQEALNERLHIRYSPLTQMYHGEFVEWLRDNGFRRLSEKIAEELWDELADVQEKLEQGTELGFYHLSSGDITTFIELSRQNVNVDKPGEPVKLVGELSYDKLITYLKGKDDPVSKRQLEQVRRLKLNGDVISEINQPDIFERCYVSNEEISAASQLILQTLQPELWNATENLSLNTFEDRNKLDLCLNEFANCPVIGPSIVQSTRMSFADVCVHVIPENISIMRCLQEIDLSRNLISDIPESFSSLTELRSINLSHNMISRLPDLVPLTNLKTLCLQLNSFRSPVQHFLDIEELSFVAPIRLIDHSATRFPELARLPWKR